MSKHSHWSQIKHKKAQLDAKKSQMIGKLINAIIIAARENNNPENNPKLRSAIERAKELKVPQENIEKAIQKGSKKEDNLEEIFYEAYLGEIQILIKVITDNKNRVLGEIKHILNRYEAKLAAPGSVRWNFEEKGVIVIDKKDQENALNFLNLIENLEEKNGDILLITSVNNLNELKKNLETNKINLKEFYIDFRPINTVKVKSEKANNLLEDLLDLDDVDDVFTNIIIE